MYIFSKSRFNTAVSYLRNALPFKSLVADVCHQLEKDGVHALANSLRLHFERNPTERTIDRKRAENALSRALNKEDYNVLSAKLKALDTNTTSISDIMMHHTHELKNTCFSLTEAGKRQHRTIALNIESIIRDHAKGRIALSEFDFDSDENSVQDVLQLIGSLLDTFGIKSITTLGAADVSADTMEGSDVDIDVYITFGNGTELHINFVAEKALGDIEELNTTLYIDGKNAEEFVDMGDTVLLKHAFYELGFYLCSAPAEADLVDTDALYYRAIASFAIPAMQFAASQR